MNDHQDDHKVDRSKHLRKLERDVLIPRLLEERINKELCRDEKLSFSNCAKEQGFKVVINCRESLKAYETCSNIWWRNEEIWKQMEQVYLEKRQKYRETGERSIPSRRRV